MDVFFLPLVTAALAEWGDKTQILALLLAIRFQKPVAVFAGVACAALLNGALAAFAGSLLPQMINHDAALLFLALGFLFAGAGAFLPSRDPASGLTWRLGAFFTTFLAFLIVEFGDKTQFITAGYGAAYPGWPFIAAGAAIGVVLGCAPAIALGPAFRRRLPLTVMKRSIGAIFLLIAAMLTINGLSLI